MAKIYDIEEFLDDKTFTYQLYADMEGGTTGTSNVQVTFTEETMQLFASFTLAGLAQPGPGLRQDFAIVFAGPTYNIGPLFSSDGDTGLVGFDYATWSGGSVDTFLGSAAVPPNGTLGGPNGDWEIFVYEDAGTFYHSFYIDGVFQLDIEVPTNELATSSTQYDYSTAPAGTITNVVIGT